METNDKLMTLLRLMDEPEAMTDAQLEELLSDEEVRKAYNVMADCKKVYQNEACRVKSLEFAAAVPASEPVAIRKKRFSLYFSLRKIAAAFIGILLLSGFAFAAVQLFAPSSDPEGTTTVAATETIEASSEDIKGTVRFDNVFLDSILSTVAAHYGKTVSFFSDEAKAMKFIIAWKSDAPLTDFIDRLNMFDGIRISLQRETIFVEITEGKEDKE